MILFCDFVEDDKLFAKYINWGSGSLKVLLQYMKRD
jgi:hypothetical protein